ncbi:MAG: 6,7-dimethyl-8-ribityllumazine synthase [Bdellovibrionales bacterium]|nr:6,7-dimethyl-8-ribityllumazine synthase [Bdellovibrionales bacterium]
MDASSSRFAIVAGRFNSFLSEPLLQGARGTLLQHGAKPENITVVHVPGSFEIPLTCKKLAETRQYDAIITVGAVIRGATSHYEHVTSELAKGIASVSLQFGIPVTFGVVTTETIEQAIERSGSKAGNYGSNAAAAAIEMIQVCRQIEEKGQR